MKKLFLLAAGIALLCSCAKTEEQEENPATRSWKPILCVLVDFSFSNGVMNIETSLDTSAQFPITVSGDVYNVTPYSEGDFHFVASPTATYSGMTKKDKSYVDMSSLTISMTGLNVNDYDIVWIVSGIPTTPPFWEKPINTIRPKPNGNTWYLEADYTVRSTLTITNDSLGAAWVILAGEQGAYANVIVGKLDLWEVSPNEDAYYRYRVINSDQ